MLALNSKNKIVTIDEALSGVDYYCGKCGGILRVKNGKKRIKHFFHLNEDCGDKGESLVHKYWKNYFLNLKGKEYKGYNIIDAREEVRLEKIGYIPDIVLKTDDNKYIVIEIYYTNPKSKEYLEKFRRIKNLEKVYEIKVDINKIIETKILYDKDYYRKLYYTKKYIIENFSKIGGLEYKKSMLYPISTVKNLVPKKKKIYLIYYDEERKIKTQPFEINLYNLNIKYIFDNYEDEELGKIEIKIPEYKESLKFSVFIVRN